MLNMLCPIAIMEGLPLPCSVTHLAFSDESHQNIGRYRGVSLMSLEKKHYRNINDKFKLLLDNRRVGELKWNKVRNDKKRSVAASLLTESVNCALLGLLRVDVLIWDIEDNRHKIRGRDDVANLQRMYYHLIKNSLIKRWPDKSTWILYPDENTAIDWDTMEDVLSNVNLKVEKYRNLFTKGKFKYRLREEFNIMEIAQCNSKHEPLIQLSDLYVGMAIYSRNCYEKYCSYIETIPDRQMVLFDLDKSSSVNLSKADKQRCQLICGFNKLCKSKKLGVSLKSFKGLRTLNPEYPVNFWWYEPQHELDKAPLRKK